MVELPMGLCYAVFRKCEAVHTFKSEESLSYQVPTAVSLVFELSAQIKHAAVRAGCL